MRYLSCFLRPCALWYAPKTGKVAPRRLCKLLLVKNYRLSFGTAGLSPSDSIGMPVAAWILSESLMNWSSLWGASQAEAVGLNVRETILTNTENESLNYQCYWLSTTIAIGGIMRVSCSPI